MRRGQHAASHHDDNAALGEDNIAFLELPFAPHVRVQLRSGRRCAPHAPPSRMPNDDSVACSQIMAATDHDKGCTASRGSRAGATRACGKLMAPFQAPARAMKSSCPNDTTINWPHLMASGKRNHAARVELPNTIQAAEEGWPARLSRSVPDHAADLASAGALIWPG